MIYEKLCCRSYFRFLLIDHSHGYLFLISLSASYDATLWDSSSVPSFISSWGNVCSPEYGYGKSQTSLTNLEKLEYILVFFSYIYCTRSCKSFMLPFFPYSPCRHQELYMELQNQMGKELKERSACQAKRPRGLQEIKARLVESPVMAEKQPLALETM